MEATQYGKLNRLINNNISINLTNEKDCAVYAPTTELLTMDINSEEAQEQREAAEEQTQPQERDQWGKGVEFLFSCIALSVGLGNVWRFPFIALENGGGAFLIPYLVVLLLVGRPVYYLEVLIGQFASRGCIRAFDMVPIMKGVAYGQVYSTALATTYYACIMALTIRYLVVSFSEVLPWTYCLVEWGPQCVATGVTDSNVTHSGPGISSAELYFTRTVLREPDNLDDGGLGTPSWEMVLCLLVTWIIIAITLFKGIRSSGKASYFLALFPYVIMLILLIRALTLPGAWQGIAYFVKPQWDQLLNPHVWYAAITQMFFSLAICFGTLVMYASFNDFRKQVHKDVIIITSIDSFTSILAGCIIFGILGNLAHETNTTDISSVVKGGAGLAFISYPEAIAKFKYLPQLFAALFFFMLLVLGIGSNIGMASSVINVVKDRFPHLPHWQLAIGASVIGFLCGLVYMTPGGQFVLNLVDFYGCTFIALVLAIAELLAVGWIYGVKRLCSDIEFMLNVKTGFYWRICWAIVAPGLMFLVLVYMLFSYEPLTYKGVTYPQEAYMAGWLIWGLGVAQLPFWAIYTIYQQPANSFSGKLKLALQPTADWGPRQPQQMEAYLQHRRQEADMKTERRAFFIDNIFG
ncbi:sodium-dependent nutrient amino acid transporter 1 [Drosophila nasuta]|uniref:sodium-dependent nutrient amino acid transporter 1 n=1 Tax=Drosophila nasuta TaxID=42062 RepID=UPI00295EC330|nr:sodium-dependent nutrient amino acid transporter 1 [Drosophila nasuta]XP_060655007.1 sodium-dependent nutrient amino acid transporter 1 [Drosophila nasuta]XP_060655008.1 sodium-dependent nutrient amino acid transporter 1 [Drosophila nasuta]